MTQPHEPVSGYFVAAHLDPLTYGENFSWPFCRHHYHLISTAVMPCRVTLANGQRVLVRALSEERKAARRNAR